jgi:predicted AAA+ superfamily ATPase
VFYRNILDDLENWAGQKRRKPLILRGARQVGKTVAVNMFARNFDKYVYLDLQKEEDLAVFSQNLPLNQLLQMIALKKNVDLSSGKRLIFLDEIQNAPEATAILRYFYEEKPEIHVIAAGSLLEIMMEYRQISFPVGRIEYRYLYPLNFAEFLQAAGQKEAFKYYSQIPVSPIAHNTLLGLFHTFCQIGGMPEIVQQYCIDQDIGRLQPIYEGLLITTWNRIGTAGSWEENKIPGLRKFRLPVS